MASFGDLVRFEPYDKIELSDVTSCGDLLSLEFGGNEGRPAMESNLSGLSFVVRFIDAGVDTACCFLSSYKLAYTLSKAYLFSLEIFFSFLYSIVDCSFAGHCAWAP